MNFHYFLLYKLFNDKFTIIYKYFINFFFEIDFLLLQLLNDFNLHLYILNFFYVFINFYHFILLFLMIYENLFLLHYRFMNVLMILENLVIFITHLLFQFIYCLMDSSSLKYFKCQYQYFSLFESMNLMKFLLKFKIIYYLFDSQLHHFS